MEINVIKQKLCTSDSVFSETFDISVENEFIMPDYCSKINKILKCFTVPRILSKNAENGAIDIEGTVYVNLLYTDEDDQFKCYKSDFGFRKKINVDVADSASIIKCSVKTEYINCKVLNERKFNVFGNLSLSVTVKNIFEREIVSDIDNNNCFINRAVIPAINTIGHYEKSTIIENEIDLTEGQKSIESIVSFDGAIAVIDVKSISDKIILKANLNLKILYITEDGGFQNLRTTVPFSQIIDVPGNNENCKCNTQAVINKLDIFPKKEEDTARIIGVSAKITMTAECYCEDEILSVSDVYSTERELEVENVSVSTEKLANVINDNYMFTKTFEFSEGSIGSIVDIWYYTSVKGSNISEGRASVEATLNIGILAYDTDGKIQFYEKSSDFTYESQDSEIYGEQCFVIPKLNEITNGYTIISDTKLEIKIEYSVNIGIYCKACYSVLENVSETENLKKRNTQCSMVVYFCEIGESVWDISKRFNGDLSKVKSLNGIEGEYITENRKIFIPLK